MVLDRPAAGLRDGHGAGSYRARRGYRCRAWGHKSMERPRGFARGVFAPPHRIPHRSPAILRRR
ncbi:hypothetical protein MBELCI_1587 [Limimaricola cinnabarinus LL-001]|uniref:Uncharacterized protein n=1 Tax=Limimaricola cinnabarinus LL-001 TaxID=1337093 RepID=U2Z2C6_9RHOB|nr:hypothetical protein MBELCI_1587 [Limimaricola cinnabarinus LL-001]